MNSDIKLDGERVLLEGKVGIGTNNPLRLLHIEGTEIHTGGGVGGFSFADRTAKNFVDVPPNGERWVWYASQSTARLWSGKDIFTVSANGSASVKGELSTESLLLTGGASNPPISILDSSKLPPSKLQAVEAANAAVAAAIRSMRTAVIKGDSVVIARAKIEVERTQNELQKATVALQRSVAKHFNNDTLVLNPAKSYTGGVKVDSKVNLNDQIILTDNSIKIRYFLLDTVKEPSQTPVINQPPRPGSETRPGVTVDVSKIGLNKNIQTGINSTIPIVSDPFSVNKVELEKLGIGEIDLVQLLLQLQAQVASLQTEVATLKTKIKG